MVLKRGLTAHGAVLTDPVIMSRSHSYGVTDLGPDGISTFFARHRRSCFCRGHWSRPRNTAVHYAMSSGTTMELRRESHAGCNSNSGRQARRNTACAAPIYEDDGYGYDKDH
ncbi:hypothetical protein COO60DRAFT_1640542 [Scenedesmus sp. NREL 46B-D3]|nr:hypothetical protein COO60DRAFT_1640542 [Scenedesmus sp. NREL 46B-D3]